MKRKVWMLAVALIAAMAVTACGNDDDDKKKDTGVEQDTGVTEDTSMDTGEEADTAEEDTGAEDTSVEDTGEEEDTGVEDTGSDDTGQPDTSMDMDTGQADTGMADTGSDADAGTAMFEEVNCGIAADAQVSVGGSPPNPNVYMPANVNINVGDVVQWTVTNGNHNVTADDDTDCGSARSDWFASPNMSVGNNYCVRFNQAGTWNYHCTVGGHCAAGMKGTVTVN